MDISLVMIYSLVLILLVFRTFKYKLKKYNKENAGISIIAVMMILTNLSNGNSDYTIIKYFLLAFYVVASITFVYGRLTQNRKE